MLRRALTQNQSEADSLADRAICDAVASACLLEATARKPGNVHPGAAFEDISYADFVRSAHVIAPVFADSSRRSVGATVLEAVHRTQASVGRNTNLGIVLLFAPLAAVPNEQLLTDGVQGVLDGLTVDDAKDVYAAIRLAQAGGLGKEAQADVSTEPTITLQEAMRLAADRDAIAAEYSHGFPLTLGFGLDQLRSEVNFADNWQESVIRLHLLLMSRQPDTLIARKRGRDEARESSAMAKAVLDAGWPESCSGLERIVELDTWLRAVGNKRNPGTTADLVAATLFAAIREGVITIPQSIDSEA